jgi:hypothetical protein
MTYKAIVISGYGNSDKFTFEIPIREKNDLFEANFSASTNHYMGAPSFSLLDDKGNENSHFKTPNIPSFIVFKVAAANWPITKSDFGFRVNGEFYYKNLPPPQFSLIGLLAYRVQQPLLEVDMYVKEKGDEKWKKMHLTKIDTVNYQFLYPTHCEEMQVKWVSENKYPTESSIVSLSPPWVVAPFPIILPFIAARKFVLKFPKNEFLQTKLQLKIDSKNTSKKPHEFEKVEHESFTIYSSKELPPGSYSIEIDATLETNNIQIEKEFTIPLPHFPPLSP